MKFNIVIALSFVFLLHLGTYAFEDKQKIDHSQDSKTVVYLDNDYRRVYNWDQCSRLGTVLSTSSLVCSMLLNDEAAKTAPAIMTLAAIMLKVGANIAMAQKELSRSEIAYGLEHLGVPLSSLYILLAKEQKNDRRFLPRITAMIGYFAMQINPVGTFLHPLAELFLLLRGVSLGAYPISLEAEEYDDNEDFSMVS